MVGGFSSTTINGVQYNNMKIRNSKYGNILFVCSANRSRSIIAEYLFNTLIRNTVLHEKGIKAYSAGVNKGWEGKNITEETRTVLSEMGIDPEGRKSKHIDKALVDWADIVLTMEIKQKHYITNLFPDEHSKVFLISEFVGEEGEVDNPYQRGIEVYRLCAEQLGRLVTLILKKIEGKLAA